MSKLFFVLFVIGSFITITGHIVGVDTKDAGIYAIIFLALSRIEDLLQGRGK